MAGEAEAEKSEHRKNARESTRKKHEAGRARKKKDHGGEKADDFRTYKRKKPFGYKGKWPPKTGPKKSR